MSEKKEFKTLDVGATERVDWRTAQGLNKYVHFDKNGNAVIGKNLEIDGTTKLNGGLEVIAEYNFSTPDGIEWSVHDYGELNESYNNIFTLRNDQGDWYTGIGTFDISPSGKLIQLFALSTIDNVFEYIYYNSSENTDMNFKVVPFLEDIQPTLYRHMIQLSGGNTADNICRLEWISSNNLPCNSLEDLRILLNNPQMNSYVASNTSGDLFGVVISPSTAQLKKVGTTSLVNITSVDDTVSAL